MSKRLSQIILAMAIPLLLAASGCAQLPTGVNVQVGPSLSADEEFQLSYYSPAWPVPGSDSETIVSGFLNAGTGPLNDYEVARAYLTSAMSSSWRPNTEVLIRSGAPTYRNQGDTLQLVDILVIAKIDEAGRFHRLSQPETRTLQYQLQQESGEWRITQAPNLTVVTLPVFEVVFQKYAIYFLDSSYRYLVPQSRWFAPSASTPTRLVNSLLQGPGDELLGALRTGIPPETRLTVDAVRVTEGTAFVDLDPNALQADASQRKLMLSQLQSTLRVLPAVSQVKVSISSNPQDISPAEISVPVGAGIMAVLKSDGVYRVSGDSATPISTLTDLVTNSQPRQMDLDDENRYLQVSASGLDLVEPARLGVDRKTLSTDANLLDPQFDAFGFAWAASQSRGRLLAFNRLGEEVELNQSVNNQLVGFQISPDGARIAEVRKTATGQELILRGIIRDGTGKPRAVVGRQVVRLTQGEPIDASWAGMDALTVMETQASGSPIIGRYPLDGPWQRLPATPSAGVFLESSPSGTSQHVVSQDGQLWSLSGGTWRLSQRQVIDTAFTR